MLDSYITIKLIKSKLQNILWQEESMALVELLKKVTSELTLKWSIDGSGESIMAQCRRDSLSITLTEIKKITESKISHLLMYLPISDYIPDANSSKTNGGNHAENVESLRKSQQNITKEVSGLVLGVKNVVSEILSIISVKENWQQFTNFHPTCKPLALMEYLCKLTRTPAGGIVLDPFGGSGTTAVACINTGRDYLVIEKDPQYCEIARKRVEALPGQKGFWE